MTFEELRQALRESHHVTCSNSTVRVGGPGCNCAVVTKPQARWLKTYIEKHGDPLQLQPKD